MIYVCEGKNCYYLFACKNPPERCPECGSTAIHAANEQEQAEHKRRQIRKGRGADK